MKLKIRRSRATTNYQCIRGAGRWSLPLSIERVKVEQTATDHLNIMVLKPPKEGKLRIVDAFGRNVIEEDLTDETSFHNIETSQMQRGLYMVIVQSGKHTSVQKVILH